MNTNTPAKFKASQYYCHRSYVPTYYWIYVYLEQWIASVVFRNDVNRVFMASDDYAFRRRFELTDMSVDYSEIEASSLRFPFANYWPLNTGWRADERLAANTAAMVYLGIYEGSTKIRASAVKHQIPVQFYFDREDDARLAYDKLFFYTYNEHYYYTDVPYGSSGLYVSGEEAPGNTISLPVNIALEGLTFNPTFKESDWLKKNRIFVIKATFDCRSYAILPPDQPNYDIDIEKALNEGEYTDGVVSYYPTEDVIFNFVNKTWDIQAYDGGRDNFPDKGSSNTLYIDSTLLDSEYSTSKNPEVKIIPESRRYYKWNSFKEDYELFDPYKYDASSMRVSRAVTQDVIEVSQLYFKAIDISSGELKWKVDNPDQLKEIQIYVDGMGKKVSLTSETASYKLENLAPNSYYYAYFEFIGNDGTVTKLRVSFYTRKEVPDTSADALVGMTW